MLCPKGNMHIQARSSTGYSITDSDKWSMDDCARLWLTGTVHRPWIIVLCCDWLQLSLRWAALFKQTQAIKAIVAPLHYQEIQQNKAQNKTHMIFELPHVAAKYQSPQTSNPAIFRGKSIFLRSGSSPWSPVPTKVILQAGSANGRGFVLRTLQLCASIPGQQGDTCTQHGHLGWGSGWLTFHLGSRRLGGLVESLLKTVGGEGRRGGNETCRLGGGGRGGVIGIQHDHGGDEAALVSQFQVRDRRWFQVAEALRLWGRLNRYTGKL